MTAHSGTLSGMPDVGVGSKWREMSGYNPTPVSGYGGLAGGPRSCSLGELTSHDGVRGSRSDSGDLLSDIADDGANDRHTDHRNLPSVGRD